MNIEVLNSSFINAANYIISQDFRYKKVFMNKNHKISGYSRKNLEIIRFLEDIGLVNENKNEIFFDNLPKNNLTRMQNIVILSLKKCRPNWVINFVYGTAGVEKYLKANHLNIHQVLEECGTFIKEPTEQQINFIYSLKQLGQEILNDKKLTNGLEGEILTRKYLIKTTGQMPVWEGNLNAKSGYDFLARFDDNIYKKIEAKFTTSNYFLMSWNEWNKCLKTSEDGEIYEFYVWKRVNNKNFLLILNYSQIKEQISYLSKHVTKIDLSKAISHFESYKIMLNDYQDEFQEII